jgi:hypothetical protein
MYLRTAARLQKTLLFPAAITLTPNKSTGRKAPIHGSKEKGAFLKAECTTCIFASIHFLSLSVHLEHQILLEHQASRVYTSGSIKQLVVATYSYISCTLLIIHSYLVIVQEGTIFATTCIACPRTYDYANHRSHTISY